MQALLVAGHPHGIDAQEFEAALQIVEAFRSLAPELQPRPARLDDARGGGLSDMSDRDAERAAVWFAWARRLPAGVPTRLVAEIEDVQPVRSVDVLRHACRLWDDERAAMRRGENSCPRPVDGPVQTLTEFERSNCVWNGLSGGPYRPVQHDQPRTRHIPAPQRPVRSQRHLWGDSND